MTNSITDHATAQETPMQQARSALAAGDLGRAIVALTTQLASTPDDVDVLTDLGGLLRTRGEAALAEMHLRKAMALAPERAGPLINLALVEMDRGELRAAAELLRDATRRDPSIAVAWNNLGLVESRCGNDAAAIDAFERGLSVAPESTILGINLSESLRRFGRLTEARARIDSVVSSGSDDVRAYCTLAEVMRDQGETEAAVDLMRKVRDRAKHDPDVRCELARLLVDAGRASAARDELKAALADGLEDATVLIALATLLEREGSADEASALLAKAGPPAAREPEALLTVARLAERAGADDEAARSVDMVIARGADTASMEAAHYMAARLMIRRGETDRGFASAQHANESLMRRSRAARGSDRDVLNAELADRLTELSTGSWPEAWDELAAPGDQRVDPRFVLGVPHSGELMITQVMTGRSGIALQSTRSAVKASIAALTGFGDKNLLQALTRMDIGRRKLARDAYWGALDTPTTGAVADTSPMALVNAHALARIFPGASYLMMLRHPCAAALSGLMQVGASSNDLGLAFGTLEDGVSVLERAWAIWKQIQGRFELPLTVLRFEEFTDGSAGGVDALQAWLGDIAALEAAQDLEDRLSVAVQDAIRLDPLAGLGSDGWRAFSAQLAPWMGRLSELAVDMGYPDPSVD